MDITWQRFESFLHSFGGFRKISIFQAQFLLDLLDRNSAYTHQWFSERQTLRHLLSPSPFYNFWDVYVSLLRDPELSHWQVKIENSTRLVLSSPKGFHFCIRYNKMLPHGVYTWKLEEMKQPLHSKIVHGHRDLVHYVFFFSWENHISNVHSSLLLHPKIVHNLLIHEKQSIDSWIQMLN